MKRKCINQDVDPKEKKVKRQRVSSKRNSEKRAVPKREQRQVTRFCSWHQLKPDPRLTGVVKDSVSRLSQLAHHASRLSNLYVLKKLEQYESSVHSGLIIHSSDALKSHMPVLDQQHYMHCMSLLKTENRLGGKVDSVLVECANHFQGVRVDNKGMSLLVPPIAVEMATNAGVSLWKPFFIRQKKTLRFQIEDMGLQYQAWKVQAMVNSSTWLRTGDDVLDTLVEHHRSHLCADAHVNETWVEARPHHAIWYMWQLLKIREACKRELFSMLPLRRVGTCFIPVQTDGLFQLMRLAKIPDMPTSVVKFGKEQELWWTRALTIPVKFCASRKTETKSVPRYRFGFSLRTDGVSVRLLFWERITPSEVDVQHEQVSWVDWERKRICTDVEVDWSDIPTDTDFIYIDPGRRDLMYAYHPKTTRKKKHSTLSKREYYEEAGMTRRRLARDRYILKKRNVPSFNIAMESISAHSLKCSSTAMLSAHLTIHHQHFSRMHQVYSASIFTRHRFDALVMKYKCLDRFFVHLLKGYKKGKRAKMGDKSNIVVVFGAAKFPTTCRGDISGPLVSLVKRLARYCRVMLIDEFRTSKKCHRCEGDVEGRALPQRVSKKEAGYDIINKSAPMRTPWALRWCRAPQCSKFIQRDLNACLNFEKIVHASIAGKTYTRPQCLQRSSMGG